MDILKRAADADNEVVDVPEPILDDIQEDTGAIEEPPPYYAEPAKI